MNMRRAKSLIVLVGALLVGVTVATQFAAHRLGGRNLGPHVTLAGNALYPPWQLFVWQTKWGAARPAVFRAARAIIAAHGVGGVLLVAVLHARSPVVRPIGAGQWATLRSVRRAGLLSGVGTVVGRFCGRLLTYAGPEHQLVVGASRSGKGVGHVIPTLLSWPESAVVHDIKGELWEVTAGFRSRFSHCLFFNPTRLDSARYNPLLEARKGQNEIRDVQNIAEMLVNPDGSKEQLDVWDQHASQLLVALILHVLYTEPDGRKHLGVVRERLLDLRNTFRDMIELPHRHSPTNGLPEPHPEVARVAKELMQQAPRFAAGVRATAAGYLALFADEIVCRNVAVSDFAVADLVCGGHPVTLYIQPPPSDLPRLRPLTRLLFNQIWRALLENLDTDNRGRPKRYRLLAELDELATMGRMEFFSVNLRQMAGYGVKAHMVVQSFNDLIERYGPHQSIIDNCHVIAVFACADTVTQQRISQMAGVAVEYRNSYGHRRLPWIAPDSVQQGEQVRPLLQPGDVRSLPSDEQLVFVTGHPPIRARKVRYYAERAFKRRVLPPPDQSAAIDTPRAGETHPSHGVPHDWLGERAKGERIPSDEILDSSQLDDEEWMPPGTVGFTEQPSPEAAGPQDHYAL